MAKTRRNLTQLRKNNKTSHLPIRCSHKGCNTDATYGTPITLGRYKWECAAHHGKAPQQSESTLNRIAKLKSMGLL